uniref:Protein BCCIP homolog n=1 Tax=Oxyrrhis marina TaxID=2969 RepID=A0A7S4GPN2_OXYMA
MGSKRRREKAAERKPASPAREQDEGESEAADSDGLEWQANNDDESDDLQVDFEYFEAQEVDYHSVRSFLVKIFGEGPPVPSEIADSVVSQKVVGTTIKTEGVESEDCLGFMTVFSPALVGDTTWMKDCCSVLRAAAAKHSEESAQALGRVLDTGKTGWIFTERLINVPGNVVPSLYECVRKDLVYATTSKEVFANERAAFKFEHMLFWVTAVRDREAAVKKQGGESGEPAPKKAKKDKGRASSSAAPLVPLYFEQDHFLSKAEFSFSYGDGRGARLVFALTKAKFDAAVGELLALRLE